MPEQAQPKIKPHPWKHLAPGEYTGGSGGEGARDETYAELHVTSNFTFLCGASHPEELVQHAAKLGHCAATITDCNTLAGVVRAHLAAKEVGIPLVVGCRLALQSSHSVLVYPTNRAAYSRLCRLLTLGKRRTTKGQCELTLHDLIEHHGGLLAVIVPPAVLDQDFIDVASGLKSVFDDDRLSIASSCLYGSDDRERLDQLMALSEHVGVPLVATNDVHYHVADRRSLQDVLTCIRLGCSIPEAGLQLFAHAERHLKSPQEMARLFAAHPQAITRTITIANRAAVFNLDELRYQYPDEVCPVHCTPMQYLIDLTWQGAAKHYPQGVPEKVCLQIENEFTLIDELNYAPYFLTVYDLVIFARSRGILCQGRGAAANSAVCYCLGVTAVDPDRIDLLFERFVSRERNEPPDIDIDFEHERREEVIQYIYSKYGRERAALTAEVITYRGKSAVREVGKALGLSLDCVDRLSKSMDWWEKGKLRPNRIRQLGLNPNEPTIHHLVRLVNEILGFPRHLSQHVGGFVITKGPLCELVPIENAAMADRTVIEWDKDDIDAMGMLKVDVLGLGMLTCIRKCFEFVNGQHLARREYTAGRPRCIHRGLNGERRKLELHAVPPEDPAVYDMICAADTIGVFQIESRAQMSMLPRLRPRCFYDLVIEVAIVRPGPIQGKMVHPYLRRRNGEEAVTYPDENVKEVLGRTLGVPLFQEQAMRLAMVGAGFTPDEADQLRRAMAAWKRKGNQIEKFGKRLIDGMLSRGYPLEFAERCFEQIKGFSDYGFPESHAASFALLVYVSAWLKKHHPTAFAAALINSQPMGFYAPAQIVRDAQEHGVEVHPVDVNCSQWDCTLEERRHEGIKARRHEVEESAGASLRLGMRLIKGLREDEANAISQAIDHYGPFSSIEPLWRKSGVRIATLRALAKADAFTSMGLDRQAALWESRKLCDEALPLFDSNDDNRHLAPGEYTGGSEGSGGSGGGRDALPAIPEPRKVVQDYAATGLSLKAHPISFIRSMLESRGAIEARQLKDAEGFPQGKVVSVAGIVLVRQRPATASGIIFMTLEDETDIANLIIRPHIYDRFRPAARHGVIILARGKVERQGEVIHVLVDRLESLEWPVGTLQTSSRDFH